MIIKGIRSVCPPIPLFFTVHFTDTSLRTADPDRSNPTRSRWERPLDTIRSFEAAIDGNYSRKSYMRTGQPSLSFNVDNTLSIAIMLTHFFIESVDSASQYNRRSSYYGGMFKFCYRLDLIALFRLQNPFGILCANCVWRLGTLIPFLTLVLESTGPPHGQLKSRRVLQYEGPGDSSSVTRSKNHEILTFRIASVKLLLSTPIPPILEDQLQFLS